MKNLLPLSDAGVSDQNAMASPTFRSLLNNRKEGQTRTRISGEGMFSRYER